MTKTLILASLFAGVAGVAGAQPVHDAVPSRLDEAVVADSPVPAPAADAFRAHLDLTARGDWLGQRASARARVVRRWLDPTSFRIASARFAVRANPGFPAIRPKITRTFVPIPLLRWQRHASLVTPHGFMAISPSIVIGRRLTWAPDLLRGGRTIGVAVQIRIWLDHPWPGDDITTGSQSPARERIFSTVRGMLGR